MIMHHCPCGGRNPIDELNCKQCGEPLPQSKVSEIPTKLVQLPEPPKKKETWRDRPSLF